MLQPFYDPDKSYEDNYAQGPFGLFADENDLRDELNAGELVDFLGCKIKAPFGIPAGPLVNGEFVKAAFLKGFDLPIFKTVRSRERSCHPWPNVVPVNVSGDLTLEKAAHGLLQAEGYYDPIAITNSFGVPSPSPDVWQPDMKDAVDAAGRGQVLIASYQGTNDGKGKEAFIEDWRLCGRLVKETGAKIIELNLSCPNEGTANVLCMDTDTVELVADAVKCEVGDIPVILKMAYFENDNQLHDFVRRTSKIVQGFAAINTIGADVRKENGEQALPGEGRLRSGVCGGPIKWAGLDMVKRLVDLRSSLGADFAVIGTGGVLNVDDYNEYIDLGADAVMSATGAMWNPYLAKEIKQTLR